MAAYTLGQLSNVRDTLKTQSREDRFRERGKFDRQQIIGLVQKEEGFTDALFLP